MTRNFNSNSSTTNTKTMVSGRMNVPVVDGIGKLVFALQIPDPTTGELKTITLKTKPLTAVDASKTGENFKISQRQVQKSEKESFDYLCSNIAPTNYNIPLFVEVDGELVEFPDFSVSFMLLAHGKPTAGAHNDKLAQALAGVDL